MRRKFDKCCWCSTTIDITNSNRELCDSCSEYPNDTAMRKAMLEKAKLTCLRCEHRWLSLKPNRPTVCPKCHSPYWNKPRVRKK